MKNTPLLTAVGIASAVTVSPVVADLATDLVAYYDFEQSGAIGLANKAPGASGTDATWTNPPVNGSVGFSGDAAVMTGSATQHAELSDVIAFMPGEC